MENVIESGSLINSKILKAPPTIYYISDFLTVEEEDYLIRQVYSAPKPKWTQLSNRRLQNWGGLPHPKGMIPETIPEWLNNMSKKIAAYGVFEDKIPNHILVNEYLPGQGIMPHEDGPLYYPTVSNVTLGSHGVLDLYKPVNTELTDTHSETEQECNCDSGTSFDERYIGSILLERRSLFLMRDDMYKTYLHGIKECKTDVVGENILNLDKCKVEVGQELERETRISLTIRVVPKVFKNKLFFGTKR